MSDVILKNIKFKNMFSYGDTTTELQLDKNPITQLSAVNGCLSGDTIIIDIYGVARTIKEIVDLRLPINILGVDTLTMTPTFAKITNWFTHPANTTYKVTFNNGNELLITDNHLLLTANGWKPLGNLTTGDWIIDSYNRKYALNSNFSVPSKQEVISRALFTKINKGRIVIPLNNINEGYQLLHILRYVHKYNCSSSIVKNTMKIYITDKEDVIRFVDYFYDSIPIKHRENIIYELLRAKNWKTTNDLIPMSYINRDLVTAKGISRNWYKQLINKQLIAAIPSVDNIRYLQIKSITEYKQEVVYDIETTTHNFIAGDTLVHNSGKSSIALVIQELLYNKNIKGIQKGDILNRYIDNKSWIGSIEFLADGNSYEVEVSRTGASAKVHLYKNGKDISDHRVPDTYKKIQEILGLDFTTFSQLTYQSSTDLLEFIKATDTNRKKFLIKLFNLEKYLELGESIKAKLVESEKQLVKLQGELKSTEDFLNRTEIPSKKTEQDLPIVEGLLSVLIADLDKELNNITATSKKIDINNLYIKERDSLQFKLSIEPPEPFKYINEYKTLGSDLVVLNNDIIAHKREISNLKLADKCITCGQHIDNSHILKIKEDLEAKIKDKTAKQVEALKVYKQWESELQEINNKRKEYEDNLRVIGRFEQLSQLIDKSLPTTHPNFSDLQTSRKKYAATLSEQTSKLTEIIQHNKNVSAHNAKVDALVEQKNNFIIRQDALQQDILTKSNENDSLTILKKAFSTSGIVAYKLENLTKEFEVAINYYLAILSDGQFQLEFSLDKEKLNINIIDNGISSPIETVSGGEFSRIQTSILLAIRSLLSKLGGSSINLLFLDEVMAVLDDAGKEGLIDVLQKEPNLNVFLISHEFRHPLVPTIEIIKENNISTLKV